MKHLARKPAGSGFAIPPGFRNTLKLSRRDSDTAFELPLVIDAGTPGTAAGAL